MWRESYQSLAAFMMVFRIEEWNAIPTNTIKGDPLRILQIMRSINPDEGGTVQAVRQYCKMFQAHGHETEVASLDSPEYISHCEFPAKVHALGPGRGIYGYASRAIAWLKANHDHYDLVIVTGMWQYCAFATSRALSGTRTPYAVLAHGMLDPYFNRRFPLKQIKKWIYWKLILHRIMRDAVAVLFTCEEEKLLARRSFLPYQIHEKIVPLGSEAPDVDLKESAEEFLNRWPELRGKRLALSLGRIHPKKATDILIQSFALALSKDPDWCLVIAGPDQVGWQKDLEILADNLGMTDRITWTGSLQGKLKWGAYAAAEVFVLPSHQENFGIVVSEALSCSLPVVLSNKINIWREVESYRAGIVAEDTLQATATSLGKWHSYTAEEIKTARNCSRQCYLELFDTNVTCDRLNAIVLGLLESSGQRGSHRI